jgi:hypothetical protein
METLAYFLTIAGFIIGLGAVTVIDTLGFLGRNSSYWTETTIRSHRVTKPLIWIGIFLVAVGSTLLKNNYVLSISEYSVWVKIIILLIANGIFLSFYISPDLLKREEMNMSGELLPKIMQYQITASFIISFVGWWSLVFLFINVIK